MSNQWLRLWHDMPTDPKWRTIAKASGQRIGDVMAVYMHILVSASTNAPERGRTQSFNCEDVASALDLETSEVAAIVDAMQARVLDGDKVKGWEKRQPVREDESAERSRAWREKKAAEKLAAELASKAPETQANAPERNRPLDTDKEEEKNNTPKAPKGAGTLFESFWNAYPKKVGKDDARKAFVKRKPDAEMLAAMVTAISSQASSAAWTKDGGQFIPNPATWLNGGRWQDGDTSPQSNVMAGAV